MPPPNGTESVSEDFPAKRLGECLHRHMDPEKGKTFTNQTDNSHHVVTKVPSKSEAEDAIVYPNVFWTSCVSFGVALGLFLVTH